MSKMCSQCTDQEPNFFKQSYISVNIYPSGQQVTLPCDIMLSTQYTKKGEMRSFATDKNFKCGFTGETAKLKPIIRSSI